MGERGRPVSEVSVEAVNRFEAEMRRMRREKKFDRAEMIYTCPETRDTLFLDYPAIYSPAQAIAEMQRIDTDHTHKQWERFEI